MTLDPCSLQGCKKPCHGQQVCLENSSHAYGLGAVRKVILGVRNKGWLWTLGLVLSKVAGRVRPLRKGGSGLAEKAERTAYDEVLGLEPGELVEVKSEREILATLDADGKNRGLLWMRGMRSHCGKRYRVFKRVETIMLESNGKLRRMRNTVLLEGVMCDGSEFFGCDRSCFMFWREAWLRRARE